MDLIGTYTLASVNGRDLPAVWDEIEAGNGQRIRTTWQSGRAVFRKAGFYALAIEGAVAIDEESYPLQALAVEGTWRTMGNGLVELHSARGMTSRWQVSTDRSVLVCRYRKGQRITFVFQRD